MKLFFQSLRLLIFFTIVTGIIYPAFMTIAGQLIFKGKVNGSLVTKNNVIIGSELIAQKFTKPEYFQPRPSAGDFNANPSGASNLGPTSSDLKKLISDRRDQLSKTLGIDGAKIPQDLLTTSASGLDPHLTPAAAKIQVARVVKARNWPEASIAKVSALVESLTEQPTFGILGEPRVNVLKLNLELDRL